MKIAYLFIVYNKPLDVFNLVRLLDNGKNTFFIHFKKGVSFTVPDDIKTKVNVIFAKKDLKQVGQASKLLKQQFILCNWLSKANIHLITISI